MGKWIFRKFGPKDVREICILCEKNLQKRKPNGTYYALCSQCNKKLYTKEQYKPSKIRRPSYRRHKKNKCEHCGFIPIHKCQLDVDHIDGNHENNNVNNLQTLCANCHRLKTLMNKDWK